MKAVILAGGLGTRLSEETSVKPKPMVEIGGMPIIWHIMKNLSKYGVNDFVICCGYKGYVIKEFFSNYLLHSSDVTLDLSDGSIDIHNNKAENWKVTLIDTGATTQTGGRLKAVKSYLEDEEYFLFTYGDGLSDVNVDALVDTHKKHNKLATVTAARPNGRYGALQIEDGTVNRFKEKPEGEESWINGGFFILDPKVIELIEGPEVPWESTPLETLSRDGQLAAYQHAGFWHAMDTLRDKNALEKMWQDNVAPWKNW
ncbi:glucose-1-phosphate cytidylyltransferase [Pseudoalteromonas umbrosa]|uniref:glucose-1-phosphate cytidylyltransferase n=1 Tax=Pseudoalteromonas umbrosa TaxID=3048489 RepID=UPI0024C210BC|nr:glucose-1-phosphate cytidylyltransferase [Pseudoalteromonas sp. B95]MDK1289569.1 glucose-1-phosphate cytidylyltransferase [Pseudoalteromonas sp. B95]